MKVSVAIYARVSSERQAQQATIDSQLAALRARVQTDGHCLSPIDEYADDGVSGATLIRPALERLRDCVAEGTIQRLYVHSPDRLARRYALQAILMEEFAQHGVAVVFIHGGEARTPEEQMLLQMQGMFAEYERAHIAERTRRGRLHKAQAGLVNVLTRAPYGYEYIRVTDHSPAAFRVMLPEARVVRDIFRWIVEDHVSIREVARRLCAAGVVARGGTTLWHTSTILGMLNNAAYVGRAEFGKYQTRSHRVQLRPPRGRPAIPTSEHPRSGRTAPEKRVIIPVPPIVTEEMYAAAQEQLQRNKLISARNCEKGRYLLQGLLQCANCGYAFGGVSKQIRTSGDPTLYYRCRGWKSSQKGHPACGVPGVRAEELDAHVWTAVKRALQEPERLVEEWAHRGTADGTTTAMREQHDRAEKAIAATEKVEQRLLDAYEAGLVDLDELQHRMERIRARLVMQRKDLTEVTTELHRTIELTGIITTLQTFGDRIRESLDTASWEQKQRIIRAIVAVVRIDISSATIIYRIPSVAAPGDGSPKEATNRSNPAGPVSPKARLRSGGATGAGKVLLPRQ